MVDYDEPEFIKVYLRDLMKLKDLTRTDAAVLYWLMQNSTYASHRSGQCVILNGSVKEEMREMLGLKNRRSIDNALTALCKSELICRTAPSIFRLNPHIFGLGNWRDISKIIMIWEYDLIQRHKAMRTKLECDREVAEKRLLDEAVAELERDWGDNDAATDSTEETSEKVAG